MHTVRLPTVPASVGIHQVSASFLGGLYSEIFKWTSLNRSPVLATRCHWQGALYEGDIGPCVPVCETCTEGGRAV